MIQLLVIPSECRIDAILNDVVICRILKKEDHSLHAVEFNEDVTWTPELILELGERMRSQEASFKEFFAELFQKLDL